MPTPRFEGVSVSDVAVSSSRHAKVRLYRPAHVRTPTPVLLWFHGGGYLLGTHRQDERTCARLARSLEITVAAATYRFAPESPFPAALDDGYASLVWLFREAEALGLRRDRMAVGGASAGGGLAAAVALCARDRGEVSLRMQLLVYPMLDDRTVLRRGVDSRAHRLWSVESNRFAWRAYLRCEPGADGVSPYAAPARCAQVEGLAPAWVGVGTTDLFYEEDVRFARRLEQGGVPCELLVVPGAFHGFDAVARGAPVVAAFERSYTRALERALCAGD